MQALGCDANLLSLRIRIARSRGTDVGAPTFNLILILRMCLITLLAAEIKLSVHEVVCKERMNMAEACWSVLKYAVVVLDSLDSM
jgi:hypothetical protein